MPNGYLIQAREGGCDSKWRDVEFHHVYAFAVGRLRYLEGTSKR
jgi:hypothetical protein